jgi:membrane protease YdiL (CAAX protease family)
MSVTIANDETLPDYWAHSRGPLSSFLFLIPLLLVYEIGVVVMAGGESAGALRNGADYWMRGWLENVGIPFTFVLPFLVTAGLLIWHICGKYSWRVSTDTFVGMLAESLLFALCLVVLGQLQDLAFQRYLPASMSSPNVAAVLRQSEMMIGDNSTLGRIISFIGAGVYEEVLFRLCLLPVCYAVFRVCFLPKKWAAFLAIFVTSLAFSVAHYIGPMADQFTLFSFSFRLVAGLFFSTLFMLRGFGITVGCHAAYDLLVGVLLA